MVGLRLSFMIPAVCQRKYYITVVVAILIVGEFVYINSLLATLNARNSIRATANQVDSEGFSIETSPELPNFRSTVAVGGHSTVERKNIAIRIDTTTQEFATEGERAIRMQMERISLHGSKGNLSESQVSSIIRTPDPVHVVDKFKGASCGSETDIIERGVPRPSDSF